ncbi:MAG: hypothetical protein FD129_86 [bacterium]|nr:MAG: hypothetical protein FD129_86 [bacterium]
MQAPRPGLIDALAIAICRPWVLFFTAALLLTPSSLLLAALNSGAAFLKIGTGARPAALGGAYTAVAGDVDAMYYNPGGLAHLTKRELGATHAEWLLGTRFDFIGFAQPTANGTFGVGVTRLATGGQEGRDANRQATSGFEAADTAYTVSYSRKLTGSRASSLGGNLKLLRSQIGPYSAQTVAVDLGAQHRFADKPLSLGASVLNIGRGLKFMDQSDPLPLTLSLGAAYRIAGPLNLALDVRRHVYDQRTDVGIGTEYAFLPRRRPGNHRAELPRGLHLYAVRSARERPTPQPWRPILNVGTPLLCWVKIHRQGIRLHRGQVPRRPLSS